VLRERRRREASQGPFSRNRAGEIEDGSKSQEGVGGMLIIEESDMCRIKEVNLNNQDHKIQRAEGRKRSTIGGCRGTFEPIIKTWSTKGIGDGSKGLRCNLPLKGGVS